MYRELIAHNTPEDWAFALMAAVAVIMAFLLIRKIALFRLERLAKRTVNLFDDFVVELLVVTRILLAAAIGLYAGVHFLELPAALQKFSDRTFIGLLLLQCGFWANCGLRFWLSKKFSNGLPEEEGSRAMTRSLLSFLGRVGVWTLVLLLVLDNLGLNVTALVASLGIGGIAVALAAQNILGDLFGSLSIAIDKPFVIGDFIIVDDLAGTVEHVGLKTTRLRSLGGEQLVFSNNDLLKSRIRNYKRMQERRAVFAVGVTYDTPAEQLEAIPGIIRRAIEAQDQARHDRAHFKGFGASSLDFEAVYYVLKPDYGVYMDVQQAVNLTLVREFAQRGIEFAFPTQTLHLNGGLKLARPAPDQAAASRPREALARA